MKIKKKNWGGGGIGSGGGWGVGLGCRVGGQGGCERRSKVFCENSKKKIFFEGGGLGLGWGGGRSDQECRIGVGEVGVARFGVGG